MGRGFIRGAIGAVCLSLLAFLACAGQAGAAGGKLERVHSAYLGASASNGYFFQLSAFRGQPGGATVALAFVDERSSVIYLRRRPATVTKHRIKADFGEIGEVDLRVRKRHAEHPDKTRCGRVTVSDVKYRGGLDLETGFSHVRSGRVFGFALDAALRRRCGGRYGPYFRSHETDTPILASCDGPDRTGLLAIKHPRGENDFSYGQRGTEFIATKASSNDGVEVITTTSASGATRRFGIRGRTARVVPPEPFAGRARFRDGRLTGNIRATLPGEGTVRLAPGRAVLGTADGIDIPRCLPPYFVSIAGRSAVEQAIATAVQRAALTRTARRALSALGGR